MVYYTNSGTAEGLENNLPEDTDLVLSLTSDKLIKSTLMDFIYRTNFEENDLHIFKWQQEIKGLKENPLLAIDWKKGHFIFFKKEAFGMNAYGFLTYIRDRDIFLSYNNISENTLSDASKNKGIYIQFDRPFKNVTEKQFFEDYIKQTLNATPSPSLNEEKQPIHFYQKKIDDFSIENINLYVDFIKNGFTVNGTAKKQDNLEIQEEEFYHLAEAQKHKHLEILTRDFPIHLYDSINKITSNFGIIIPPLKGIQLLYYGISIDNIQGSSLILPKFDAIFNFQDSINIDEMIASFKSKTKAVNLLNKEEMQIGNLQYYYKQLSDNEVYIGTNNSPSITKVKQKRLPYLKGNPSSILDIDGESIIAKLINVLPQIKNTKDFFEQVEDFDWEITENGEELEILGRFAMKEGSYMNVELIKLLLTFMNN